MAVERCYVMWNELEDLTKNWALKPEFEAYVAATEKIPDLGEKKYADKSFFDDAPVCFFEEYRRMFVKHVSTIVRSNEILVYLVGGNPILARMLLQWLICAEDGDVPMAAYVFKEENIVLQNQGSDTETVSVNTRKCMIYLTQLADPKEILKDDLIVDQKDLWWKMGFSDSVVDLFGVST